MTRAEFAKIVDEYFGQWVTGKQTALEYLNDAARGSKIYAAIAAVATNGFDPEPTEIRRDMRISNPITQAGRNYNARLEQAQEAAKRSRPFVGSHNLPFNSDYD